MQRCVHAISIENTRYRARHRRIQQLKRNPPHGEYPTAYAANQVHSSACTQFEEDNAGAAVPANAASYNSNINQRERANTAIFGNTIKVRNVV